MGWVWELEKIIREVDEHARNEAKIMKGVKEAIRNGSLNEIWKNAGIGEDVLAEIREIIGKGVDNIKSTHNSLEIYCNGGHVTFTDREGAIFVETFPYVHNISHKRRPILYNDKYRGSKGKIVYESLEELRKIKERSLKNIAKKRNLDEKSKRKFATSLETLINTFNRISAGEEFYSVKMDTEKYRNGLRFEVIK